MQIYPIVDKNNMILVKTNDVTLISNNPAGSTNTCTLFLHSNHIILLKLDFGMANYITNI
jgi:hypothetical protein